MRLPLSAVLALLIATIAVVIDFATWVELNVSIVYGLPLILAAQSRSRRLLWTLAGALLAATFTVYWLQIPPSRFSLREPFFVDRLLAAVAMLVTAALTHVWINAVEVVEAQDRRLMEQNEELQRLRQDAEEASARKTRLLSSVSHDLRSPVNAIRLMAEVIRRTAEDPTLSGDVGRLSLGLQRNAQALTDFLSNMLEISALDSGCLTLKESEFSLNELLSDECSRLLPLAHAKRLKLLWHGPEPPARLRTDRTKLARVLANLLTNAIKFTESGEVAVDAAITTDRVVKIRVRDTGIGIGPEDVKRAFDDFVQLDVSTADPNTGWGLGLAICRRLVEFMGGTISIDSQLKVGSVFTVQLPASCVICPAHTAS